MSVNIMIGETDKIVNYHLHQNPQYMGLSIEQKNFVLRNYENEKWNICNQLAMYCQSKGMGVSQQDLEATVVNYINKCIQAYCQPQGQPQGNSYYSSHGSSYYQSNNNATLQMFGGQPQQQTTGFGGGMQSGTIIQQNIQPTNKQPVQEAPPMLDEWEIDDTNNMTLVDNNIIGVVQSSININGANIIPMFDINIRDDVKSYNEAIGIVRQFITSKQFISVISYTEYFPVDIEPSVIINLLSRFQSLESNINSMDSIRKILDMTKETMESLTSAKYKELERYFVYVAKPMIRSCIIHPKRLNTCIISSFEDILSFVNDPDLMSKYADCDFYSNYIRYIILKTFVKGLQNLIDADDYRNRTTLIRALNDRYIIKNNIKGSCLVASLEEIEKDNLMDSYKQVFDRLDKISVFRIPKTIIYGTYIPADLIYKLGDTSSKPLDPYVYRQPSNVLEDIINTQIRVDETHEDVSGTVVLAKNNYQNIIMAYGKILDSSTIILPGVVEY